MDFRKKKDTKRSLFNDRMFWTKWHSHIFYHIENSVIITGKVLGTIYISALTKDHADLWRDGNEKHGDVHRY